MNNNTHNDEFMEKDEIKNNKFEHNAMQNKSTKNSTQKNDSIEKNSKPAGQTNYSSDFDDVFKSMKHNNTSLFIPVINESFGRNYSYDEDITLLPSEGDITKISEGRADIDSKTSDFLLKIRDELYLLECQSYADGSMAIRIAEYAFIAAKQYAVWEYDRVTLEMPNYRIIYVKSTGRIPSATKITYKFPDGQMINYDAKNIILKDYSMDEILKKRLYPYIPYYILRYEKELKNSTISINFIENELRLLLKGLESAFEHGNIDVLALCNIRAFTNTILEHIMTGNKNKERLVKIMGGQIIYTEADLIHEKGRLEGRNEGRSEGKIEQYIETSKEYNATDEHIINGLITKFNLTPDEAEKLVLHT